MEARAMDGSCYSEDTDGVDAAAYDPGTPPPTVGKRIWAALRSIASSDDDTSVDIMRKNLALSGSAILLLAQAFTVPFAIDAPYIYSAGLALSVIACLVATGHVLWRRKTSNACVIFCMTLCTLAVICMDLGAVRAAASHRKWPFFILIADVLMIFEVGHKWVAAFTGIALAYVVLIQVEFVTRFGLFDLPGLTSGAGSMGPRCGCHHPCSISLAEGIDAGSGEVMIIVFNLLLMQNILSSQAHSNAKQEETIILVGSVTEALALFSLDDVEDQLHHYDASSVLQSTLKDSLLTLVRNLKSYRPFLPDALFCQLHDPLSVRRKTRHLSIAPPGINASSSTLAFTDIKGSTVLWECDPEGMQRALKIHNSIIRDEMDKHGGYEVKTIGDAFMVAFEQPEDAVYFGMSVQETLMTAAWPPSFVHPYPNAHPFKEQCRDPEQWKGLVVRIGIHTGEASLEVNTLTGRCDYLGQCVNKAARIESVGVGGAVAVSEEALKAAEKCGPRNPIKLMEGIIIPMGIVPLKGVTDITPLYLLLPGSLRGREAAAKRELSSRGARDSKQKDHLVVSAAVVNPLQTATSTFTSISVTGAGDDITSTCSTAKQVSPVIAAVSAAGHPDSKDMVDTTSSCSTHRLSQHSVGSSSHGLEASPFSVGGSFRIGVPSLHPVGSFAGSSAGMEKICTSTVGCLELRLPQGVTTSSGFNPAFCAAVSTVVMCLHRTEGSSLSLCSNSIMLGWNATSQCKSHLVGSLRFIHLLNRNALKATSAMHRSHTVFHLGICTGHVAVGHVGSISLRHMACVGPPVAVAVALSLAARNLSTFCLYSSFLSDPDGTVAQVMRPVDRVIGVPECESPGGLLLSEVSPNRVGTSAVVNMVEQGLGSDDVWGWTDEYRQAFRKGDSDTIRTECEGDPVLLRVAAAMDAGDTLLKQAMW